jgi:hypothetical protein
VAGTSPDRLKRIAENEVRFRDLNEKIESGRDPADSSTLIGFICECGQSQCERLVELTAAEYEHVRSNPHHFALLAGHQVPEAEVVVEVGERYVVVAKRPQTWSIVETTDPRAPR